MILPSVGVFAVVKNKDNEVLCVKLNYGSGNWTLPGGHLDKNESPIEGVEREILEETGYIAKVENLVGIYSAPEKDDLVLLFRAGIKSEGRFIPNEEIKEIAFFSRENLPLQMHPWNRKRILDSFSDTVSFVHTFNEAESI
ncbi:NUDIX domain-containing protein [Rossellomorea vietnamensis]|uniref:NUDIX domain-containing protein n=1 Tax=Rossellomorea vietnamensis TaxID=218284 RepID=A0A5D4NYP5_9BACI|nr:NUDIX domain-containing protein [Rossellomorea vietnamensis]